MPFIDYENNGTEHEYEATTYTLVVYEQEFKKDLIKDVFGRVSLVDAGRNIDENGNVIAMDFTIDNWMADLRAFWAMLRTSAEIARSEGRRVEPVPSFVQWCLKTRGIDMAEITRVVFDECQRGLFRSGAADSEKTGEEE